MCEGYLHLPRRRPNHCWTHSGVPACEEERRVLQKPHKAAALDVGSWWLEGACTLQAVEQVGETPCGGWPCWVRRRGPFLGCTSGRNSLLGGWPLPLGSAVELNVPGFCGVLNQAGAIQELMS